MDSGAPVEFAVRGERGIDIFRRLEDENARRARYECLGSVETKDPKKPAVLDFAARFHQGETEHFVSLAAQLDVDPALKQVFCLSDTTQWPCAYASPDPMLVFLHLEFFRAWQVADMALRRFVEMLEAQPQSLPHRPHALPGAVIPAFQFNRLSLGRRLAQAALPVIETRLESHGNAHDDILGTGYALRMLGDLALRDANPALALQCFEMSLAAGENPHRRTKAIEAAHLAHDHAALGRHLDAFAAKEPLHDWMKSLGEPGE